MVGGRGSASLTVLPSALLRDVERSRGVSLPNGKPTPHLRLSLYSASVNRTNQLE